MSLEINDLDELKQFLDALQQKADPEARKQQLEYAERMKERQLAHEEKLKALEHEVRLRSIAAGHQDPENVRARARAATRIACWVSLFMAAAAGAATWKTIDTVREVNVLVILVAIIWGISGLVSLIAVVGGMLSLRWKSRSRSADGTPRSHGDAGP